MTIQVGRADRAELRLERCEVAPQRPLLGGERAASPRRQERPPRGSQVAVREPGARGYAPAHGVQRERQTERGQRGRARRRTKERELQQPVQRLQRRPVRGRRGEHERGNPVGVVGRQPDADRPAEAVTGDHRPADPATIQLRQRCLAVAGQIARPAAAVPPGAVDRDRLRPPLQRRDDAGPVASAAGLAVQHQYRWPTGARPHLGMRSGAGYAAPGGPPAGSPSTACPSRPT